MWHADLKWMLSFLAIAAVWISLLITTAFVLTGRETLVTAMTLTYGVLISGEKGIDSPDDVEQLKAEMRQAPNQTITPVPAFAISISLAEVEHLSPRQARLAFIRKFTEPIYDSGADGLASLTNDPVLQAKVLESRTTLDLLSIHTHNRLRSWQLISWAVAAILILLAVFFSYRFGRAATPGWILLMGSLPGTLLWWLILMNPPGLAGETPTRVSSLGQTASFVAGQTLPEVANRLLPYHRNLLFASLLLIVSACLGGLMFRSKPVTDGPTARP